MNEYELNEDQIRRIEARLNLLRMDMEEYKDGKDIQHYKQYAYAAGRANGICMMLDELGYDAVWNSELGRCQLRRAQRDGRQ